MKRFNPKEFEPKWQKYWDEHKTYQANLKSSKPKYIAMSMFNYPSGAGIHIGHAMNYTISDVMARAKRQQGFESYHPVGWDSFGLPAENYAIKSGVSPQASMKTIIPNYHSQYKAMGWSNDWSKEIATHEPEYYKWTQWIFSEMYRAGMAYQDSRMQWWCDKCQTVLANEQVINDKCWRHDSADDPEVTQREVKQWFFKITDYADELLDATDELDWTESVKLAQKNWIGKSVGAEVDFALEGGDKITVFTTRPDTLYGATFLVLAPEHELVNQITDNANKDEVKSYVKESLRKSEVERQANKDKTGVFTGAYAINPVNNEKVPIWIADYVLMGYGTGAIMAVPAHDERDHEFAQKFNLPIRQVVANYEIFNGEQMPIEGKDTVRRKSVDAIICDKEGNYVLLNEGSQTHFVGGGVEDGEDDETALRREVIEETGYTDIESIKQVSPAIAGIAYRHTKDRNQQGCGAFYEVVLASKKQVKSELDDGKHEMSWVKKSEVAKKITWSWHLDAWNHYQAGGAPELYEGEGVLLNSGEYDWLPTSEAREKIVTELAKKSIAKEKVNYRMRDWSVSRQRYWGAPIPIVHCKDCGPQLVPDKDLPVLLPELVDFAPSGDGRSALARAKHWLRATCPNCGKDGERETDTLDTYICSSWYMLRYFNAHNADEAFAPEITNKWMPIDFYNGADHATAHMIYARFITRFFHKKGLLKNPEPFKKFLFNGKVTAADGQMFSKSKGNGVDPLEIINQGYGADALRTYLMFAAPLELWAKWDPQGVPGTYRFLARVWALVQEFLESKPSDESNEKIVRQTHQTIIKVTDDIENQKYNTAIAALMQLTNDLFKAKASNLAQSSDWRFAIESLIMMIAPFAPHTADELWHQMGHNDSVTVDNWPQFDSLMAQEEMVNIAVQVNGKLRATISATASAGQDDVEQLAKKEENVQKFIENKMVRKIIYVPSKIINFVV